MQTWTTPTTLTQFGVTWTRPDVPFKVNVASSLRMMPAVGLRPIRMQSKVNIRPGTANSKLLIASAHAHRQVCQLFRVFLCHGRISVNLARQPRSRSGKLDKCSWASIFVRNQAHCKCMNSSPALLLSQVPRTRTEFRSKLSGHMLQFDYDPFVTLASLGSDL